MEQKNLLTVGTSNLRKLRLNQHHKLRSVFRIQQLIFNTMISPEELEQSLKELNCTFDVALLHSGNYLLPTKLHRGHICLDPTWNLNKTTDYIATLIKVLEKYSKLIIITETHPRSLYTPRECESFNSRIQFRFRRLIKQLMLKRALVGNVRFLSFTMIVKDYFLIRTREKHLPWRYMPVEFARRFLTFSGVHLNELGNDILQDLTASHILRIFWNHCKAQDDGNVA